ncbi:MAG: hypothetical protein ACJ8KX_09865 [Chthoniobacterales bacterium]
MILRDAVHGLISFEAEEERVIPMLMDTPEVQRLRRIRQLGVASYAFPGAEHTRFAHASPSPTPAAKVFDIRPLKKTFVRITIDTDKGRSSFERWVDVNAPVQLRGKRIAVKVLDPADVEFRKNGKLVARGDSDVRLE